MEELYYFGFLLCFVLPVYDLLWFILWTWSFLLLSVEFFILVLIWSTRNFFLLVEIVCEVESLRAAKCSLFAGTFSFWIGRDRIFWIYIIVSAVCFVSLPVLLSFFFFIMNAIVIVFLLLLLLLNLHFVHLFNHG